MEPLVSIIIVNYNGKKYLRNCFDSLEKGRYRNFEIIFVDNGSKDGSCEFVRQEYPWVKILDNKENLGLAIASNRGAELAKGDYLFFLNNDTISHPDILSNLVSVMENNTKVGVCACKNMTYDGKYEVCTGVSCDIFGFPCGNESAVFYADAGIFIRKSVFEEIQGFDPKLFLYGEDRDLCWRVLLQGYDIIGVPAAVFYHDSACTSTGTDKYTTNIWKRYLGEYNLIRSMLKNYSTKTLLYIIPQYLILSFLEIMFLLCKGEIKPIFSSYLKAYIDNIGDFRDTWQQHRSIQKIRKVSDSVIQKKMVRWSGKIKMYKKIGVPKFDNNRMYKN
jgi:hypothetical protein